MVQEGAKQLMTDDPDVMRDILFVWGNTASSSNRKEPLVLTGLMGWAYLVEVRVEQRAEGYHARALRLDGKYPPKIIDEADISGDSHNGFLYFLKRINERYNLQPAGQPISSKVIDQYFNGNDG